MGWLDGQVALITGGGSGLGNALVNRFIAEGATVSVLERSPEHAQRLRERLGDQVSVTEGDVTRFSDNLRAVSDTVARFGKLDTFVANAGVFDFFQGLAQTEGETLSAAFDELFGVNVKGGLLGARAALSELVKTRGNVIFTLSNAAFYPGGGGPLYTASKHALVGVVKQLAHEFAPKVQVNGVAPGGMRTGLGGLAATGTDQTRLEGIGGFDAMVEGITPMKMCPRPEDYCGPYVLLASRDNAGPMTGAIINTDGGLGVRGLSCVRGGEDI